MPTLRTFVAVEIDEAIRRRAAEVIGELSGTSAKVKWVEPEQMHFTLKFLGEVDIRDTAAICKAVAKAAERLAPFEIKCQGVGAFPKNDRPRTVWLGVSQGEEEMVTLHDGIDDRLAKLGHRQEHRRFRPHLTIGRVRQSTPDQIGELAAGLEQFHDFDAGEMLVREVVVFSSTLAPTGPTYTPLGTARLKG